MNQLKYLLAIYLFVIVPIFAQTSDVTNEPGYFDLGDLSSLENSTGVTEIILEEDLLSVLATISNEKDPNIMAILEGLKLVKANVYQVNEDNQDELKDRVNDIDSRLSSSEWKRIVRTRSSEEIANVYIRLNNDKQIVGLVVTSVEQEGDAAFVNIVGNIDLATIGKLGKRFHIPSLDGVNGKK
jgi:hypothetical protein